MDHLGFVGKFFCQRCLPVSSAEQYHQLFLFCHVADSSGRLSEAEDGGMPELLQGWGELLWCCSPPELGAATPSSHPLPASLSRCGKSSAEDPGISFSPLSEVVVEEEDEEC